MSLENQVGRLTGVVEGLQKDVTEVKTDVKALLAEKNQRSGGWKVVAGISAVVASIVAFLVNLLKLGQ